MGLHLQILPVFDLTLTVKPSQMPWLGQDEELAPRLMVRPHTFLQRTSTDDSGTQSNVVGKEGWVRGFLPTECLPNLSDL